MGYADSAIRRCVYRRTTVHAVAGVNTDEARTKAQVRNSQCWALDLVARLLTSSKRGKVVFIPLLVVALSFNFAILELVILILVGFFIAKLQCYRFVNSMMGLLSFSF